MDTFELNPVGRVESTLTDLAAAPRQPDEGAPDAWVVLRPEVHKALDGIAADISATGRSTASISGVRSQIVTAASGARS